VGLARVVGLVGSFDGADVVWILRVDALERVSGEPSRGLGVETVGTAGQQRLAGC
jgi:hypothetical protein